MRPSFCVLLAESFKEWIVRMQRFVTTLKDSDLSLSINSLLVSVHFLKCCRSGGGSATISKVFRSRMGSFDPP